MQNQFHYSQDLKSSHCTQPPQFLSLLIMPFNIMCNWHIVKGKQSRLFGPIFSVSLLSFLDIWSGYLLQYHICLRKNVTFALFREGLRADGGPSGLLTQNSFHQYVSKLCNRGSGASWCDWTTSAQFPSLISLINPLISPIACKIKFHRVLCYM